MRKMLFAALAMTVLTTWPCQAQEKKPDVPAKPEVKAPNKVPQKHPRGRVAMPPEKRAALHVNAVRRNGDRVAKFPQVTAPKWDCRDLGNVLPVNDQGPCGDCFGVSSADGCSMALIKAGKLPNDTSKGRLSSQYGLDCGKFEGGCNGGDEAQVIDEIMKHGFPLTSDYGPYTASPGRCRDTSSLKMWKIDNYGFCTPNQQGGIADTQDMKNCMVQYGPLSVAFDAGGCDSYRWPDVMKGGGRNIDHAVLCIGWDDDKQAFLGMNQWGCYNEDMDILTDRGWMNFKDIREDEVVATLNPATQALEYHRIEKKHVYDFDGELFHYKSQGVDLMVTPNHKMYIGTRKDRANNSQYEPDNWRLEKAEDITQNRFRMKKDANWTVPDVASYRVGGVDIPMDLWLEFLGYFVSEGHTTVGDHPRPERQRIRVKNGNSYEITESARIDTNYIVGISQKDGAKAEVMQKCLDRMPFKFRRDKNGWTTNRKVLWEELLPLGKSYEKILPAYVRTISQRQSNILLDALMLGDGTKLYGNYVYFTSSQKLADNVQELALKAGHAADVSHIDRVGRENAFGTTRHIEYRVSIKTTRVEPCPNDGWNPAKVPYHGKVYCVTVPNHVVYVRRNGQATWCGNSNWGGPGGTFWIAYGAWGWGTEAIWIDGGQAPPPPPGPGPGPQPVPGTGPVITSNLTAVGQVGAAFSYQITASGAPTAFAAQGLPAGLTVNTGTGLISGTPSAAGTSSITLLAANSSGAGSATLSLTVTVGPAPGPGSVTIALTPDQVASVIAQTPGAVIITKEMTVEQLLKVMQAAKDGRQCCGKMSTGEPPPADKPLADKLVNRLGDIETDVRDMKRAIKAIMAILTPKEGGK